jgi:hypothetical protein
LLSDRQSHPARVLQHVAGIFRRLELESDRAA